MIENERVGYWASRVVASFKQACGEVQDQLGITDDQSMVLSVLDQQGPLGHAEVEGVLAEFWRQDVTHWESAVGEMMVRELVDMRDGKFALTDFGREINRREQECVALMRHEICAGLSTEEYQQTLSLLKKLACGAEKYLDAKESRSSADALQLS